MQSTIRAALHKTDRLLNKLKNQNPELTARDLRDLRAAEDAVRDVGAVETAGKVMRIRLRLLHQFVEETGR